MKIPVAIKILNEATGPKANVEFMDVSLNQFQCITVFCFFPRIQYVQLKLLTASQFICYIEVFHQVVPADTTHCGCQTQKLEY